MLRYLRMVLLTAVICTIAQQARAQQRWFEFTSGLALSVPQAKGSPWHYKARLLPHAGLSGFFAFNNVFALKTGLLYEMKGYSTVARYVPDSLYTMERFTSKTNYHFFHIPLQLAASFGHHNNGLFRMAAGMSYGFLVGARSSITVGSFDDQQQVRSRSISFDHLIALQKKDGIAGLPHHEGTSLYLFTPAVRIDLTYIWQERLLMTAFYEYTLQDSRTRTVNNSSLRLHYAGLALGVLFW